MFEKWTKKEEDKPVETFIEENIVEDEDIVQINYKGKHWFHLTEPEHRSFHRNGRNVYGFQCDLYLKGNGRASFKLDGKIYDLNIEPYVCLESYSSQEKGYLGALEMSEEQIVEKLKEDLEYKVSTELSKIRERDAKKLFEQKKFTFDININVAKSKLK